MKRSFTFPDIDVILIEVLGKVIEHRRIEFPLGHYLLTSCFFGKDFCHGSPGAPISVPL